MAQRRGVLFLNPRAGSFSMEDDAALRAAAEEHGLRVVEIVPGINVRDIVKSALDAGLRSFVVAGGDGSIHHVIQALANTDGVLGIVPAGSVNHFARDLKLPFAWREALEIAVRGEVRQIDTGRINGIYFLNSVMLGLYPTISEYRERFRSSHSRWRAYLRAARFALRKFPHVTLILEHDGRVETISTQMFSVAVNAYDFTQTGLVSPKMSLDDGRLSIYSLSFMSRWQFIRVATKFYLGRISHTDGFRRVRTTQLRVDTARPNMRVAIDGELHDMKPPLQIVAAPASLLVRVPVATVPAATD